MLKKCQFVYIYINQKILKGTRKTGRHSFPVFWGWDDAVENVYIVLFNEGFQP